MGLEFEYIEGQSPLDEDEKEGLIVKTISTRGELDEIAVRFKHRLVQIHLFPNGNGRHSRLCADILISQGLKMPIFTWGRMNLSKKGKFRKKYLKAIYAADGGDYKLLIEFARS